MQRSNGSNDSEGSRKKRVLLVDDEPDGVELVSRFLRREGYEVEIAADAEAAIGKVTSLRPDLAIVDIGLPGTDGYELARRLRELTDCKLIALSGYAAGSARPDTAVTAFDRHLLKPVNLTLLLKTLDELAAPRVHRL
jgi:CheY-like chemotaxis protein